jgi:hypothetical protein
MSKVLLSAVFLGLFGINAFVDECASSPQRRQQQAEPPSSPQPSFNRGGSIVTATERDLYDKAKALSDEKDRVSATFSLTAS